MKTSSRTLSWGGSLILVIGLHAGLFIWALYWQPQAKPIELPPAAMLIELEPLAAPKPPPPPPPQVQPQEPEPQPKRVEAPKPKLAIALPQPKPRPPKPVEPKPQLKPQDKPPQQTAPAPVAAADKPAAPQQAAASAPSQAKASWQSQLLSHLSRYKRYPDDARRRGLEGVNRLRFVVDGNGKVLSYSLAGKSGNLSLDRATLQMIRRAQPLPPPPAEMLTNGTVEIVAPFVYALERR